MPDSVVIVALPAADEADGLAVDGGVPADDLHVTLAWLGTLDDDGLAPPASADELEADLTAAVDGLGPREVRAAGTIRLDPEGDDARALLVEGEDLTVLRGRVLEGVGDESEHPTWVPHMTLAYGSEGHEVDEGDLRDRVGPITLDRVAVLYGAERREIALETGGGADTPEDGAEPADAALEASSRRIRAVVPRALREEAARYRDRKRKAYDETAEDSEPADAAEPAEPDGGDVSAETSADGGWEGVLAVEGTPTGDGRVFDRDAIRWDEDSLPLPLRWAAEEHDGHDGARVVGTIDEVWRDGDTLYARGRFDTGSDAGREAHRLVREGILTGVSVDLDDTDVEVRADPDSALAEEPDDDEAPVDPDDEPEPERADDGRVIVHRESADDELLAITSGRLRAATLVDVPAFAEARVEAFAYPGEFPFDGMTECIDRMTGEVDDPGAFCAAWYHDTHGEWPAERADAVTASGAPARPPEEWFADPGLTEPTPLTVTDDGRVYGHLAAWGTCHTAYDGCVSPPSSPTGYAWFHTGEVVTADGGRVPAGRITLATDHAGRKLGAAAAAAHYEDTGRAVADVVAGEDAHGIYVAGAVRPNVDEATLRDLRASPLSGDWRRVGRSLELVHALAVNNPGFPIPRARVASGRVASLQAAGVVRDEPARRDADLSSDDRRRLRRLLDSEARAEADRAGRAAAARRRVLAASARARTGQHRSRRGL